MRTIRTLAVALGLACSLAIPAAAQRPLQIAAASGWLIGLTLNTASRLYSDPDCPPTLLPTPRCLRSEDAARSRTLLHMRASDYRYEGLAIGGGIGLVGGVLLGAIACDQSDDSNENCAGDIVKGGLLLGSLGGIAGLVIGGVIDKHP
ncbi:MAG TPA: hypothetical protein VF046_02855 [Gemmatimonadales bacterium]